jgi:hypothetical protein
VKRKTGFGFSSLCFFEFSTCAVTPRQQQQQQQLQVQVQVQQQGLQGQVGQGQVMGRIAPESIGTGTGLLVKAANCAVVGGAGGEVGRSIYKFKPLQGWCINNTWDSNA